MKILLIDNSATMRHLQKPVLAQLGFTETREASDGKDALHVLESFEPDLIICDSNMPEMDGLSFVRAFRARNDSTPIIMCTPESQDSAVVAAIKAGVDNYVVKPFTPDLLSQRVQETMAKAKAA